MSAQVEADVDVDFELGQCETKGFSSFPADGFFEKGRVERAYELLIYWPAPLRQMVSRLPACRRPGAARPLERARVRGARTAGRRARPFPR